MYCELFNVIGNRSIIGVPIFLILTTIQVVILIRAL